MPSWEDFLRWAARVTETVDLDDDERDYKIAMAAKIRDACELTVRDDPGWREAVGRAIAAGNLLSWQVVDYTKRTMDLQAAQMRDAIVALWRADDPVAAMDRFAAQVESAGLTGRPGGVTSLASDILMGRDPAQFPPYRAEFVRTWAKAVGAEPPGASTTSRYATLLHLCDELLERAPAAGIQMEDRLDAQGLAWATMQYPPPPRWTPLDQAKLVALRKSDSPEDAVVERGHGRAPEVEEAAWLVLGPGLRGGVSPFGSDRATWTEDVASDLLARLEADTPGSGVLMDRLARHLEGAADATVLLAAELMCIRLLPLTRRTVRAEKKVADISQILSWTRRTSALPAQIEEGLRAEGAFHGGLYNRYAIDQLKWFCRLIQRWTGLPAQDRASALDDPFKLIEVTLGVPHDIPTARYVLEYLTWPGIFPPVVNDSDRKSIHKKLMPDMGDPSGTDELSRTRDLAALWRFHEDKDQQKPEWYSEPFVSRWREGAIAAPRAWLVRSGEGGSALLKQWLDSGFVSLKAHMLGDLPQGSSEKDVREAVKSGYMHLDATQQEATTRAYHWFLSVMKPDDLVATLDQGVLRIGVIVGDPEYVESKNARLRRSVAWGPRVVSKDELPAVIASRLEQQGFVVDLTSAYDELAAVANLDAEAGDEAVPSIVAAAEYDVAQAETRMHRDHPLQLPEVTDALAHDLYMARESLQEMVDLLQARQQMVFFGPPGTGKTFIAKRLAHHLVGDPSHYRLVQFHPSYAYEDFFEGYRPTLTESGQPTFELRPGPLKQLVSECKIAENRGQPFILIIDEMNRANLAKVFGELYFLLEYRDETVQLQYQKPGSEPFFLPKNLFIIGTMNTTDRSIALVDAAIRRRFPFYELHPGQEPVRGVLREYLRRHELPDERARLLDALNEAMGEQGRDLHIGPSYFMGPNADGEDGLERIWRYDMLPLLEEHFYGQMSRDVIHERFGLPTIRRQAAANSQLGSESAGRTDDPPEVDEPVGRVGEPPGLIEPAGRVGEPPRASRIETSEPTSESGPLAEGRHE